MDLVSPTANSTTFSVAFLLDNGALYHMAHSVAITEYLITLWVKPTTKEYAYVTTVGKKWFVRKRHSLTFI